jgi:hypothetical protein
LYAHFALGKPTVSGSLHVSNLAIMRLDRIGVRGKVDCALPPL